MLITNHSFLKLHFASILNRQNKEKMEALERRFTDPLLHVKACKEFEVLQTLQKRISLDIQQCEIIVNYLTDKYGDLEQPQKKRVKLSTLQ